MNVPRLFWLYMAELSQTHQSKSFGCTAASGTATTGENASQNLNCLLLLAPSSSFLLVRNTYPRSFIQLPIAREYIPRNSLPIFHMAHKTNGKRVHLASSKKGQKVSHGLAWDMDFLKAKAWARAGENYVNWLWYIDHSWNWELVIVTSTNRFKEILQFKKRGKWMLASQIIEVTWV